MTWPSNSPDDYRGPYRTPRYVVLRLAAWLVLAVSIVLLLFAAVTAFFGPLANEPEDVAALARRANHELIASGVAFALCLATAAWSAFEHGRGR